MKKIIAIAVVAVVIMVGLRAFPAIESLLGENSNKEVISPIGNVIDINTLGATNNKKSYTIYGYLPYWTVSQKENFKLNLLTDISYFGLEINSKGNLIKSRTNDEGEEINHSGYWVWENDYALRDFMIRAKNSGVRTSISVVSHVDNVSEEFLLCEPCWETFYLEISDEMSKMGIKDLNLNFENYYLVEENIALKFTEFVTFLKKKMRNDFAGGEIVVTAMADSVINQRITHIPSIAKVADKIFIMAYDFHIKPEASSGPVSPMGGAGLHAGYDIRTMIKDFLAYAPPQKLIMGVPYYGFNWETEPNNNKEDMPKEDSVYSITQTYAQIMANIENDGIETLLDEPGQVPYYKYTDPESNSERKVFFENEKSLRVKYKIVKEFDLAGIGIWALGYDEDRPELWNVIKEEFY